jgi:PII-like signaling protein
MRFGPGRLRRRAINVRRNMHLPEHGKLLRIFLSETDRHESKPLYQWIVEAAKAQGLAGATVLRGLEGYGAHSRLHVAKVMRLSMDLPIVVEIVDTADKIEAFLPIIDAVINEGLATVESVEIRFYRSRNDHVND